LKKGDVMGIPPLIKGFPSLPVLARPGKKRGQGRFIGDIVGLQLLK